MSELLNRVFKLWSYTVSHNFLILRSPLKYPDQEGFDENYEYNIDIEFYSVAYIDVPSRLNGLIITELNNNYPPKFQNFVKQQFKIFKIESENVDYYVVAGGFRIGKNKWLGEDRITNISLEHEILIK